MIALLFAIFVAATPNPNDRHGYPYLVPLHYSVAAWELAALYPNVEPEDLIAIIVAEHGGQYPYPADSIGNDGEIGLMQTTGWERRRFNWCHDIDNTAHEKHESKCGVMTPTGLRFVAVDLLDWQTALTVAAFTMHRIAYVHATKDRCLKPVKVCTTDPNADGSVGSECKMAKQTHTVAAHYRCSVQSRERCQTQYRDRLTRKFAQWKLVIKPGSALLGLLK